MSSLAPSERLSHVYTDNLFQLGLQVHVGGQVAAFRKEMTKGLEQRSEVRPVGRGAGPRLFRPFSKAGTVGNTKLLFRE